MKNIYKKAMSDVVTTIILIALALVLVGVVWGAVSKIVQGELGNSQACFGIFDQVSLNERYTCYNSSAKQLIFSLNIKDIDVDSVVISIDSEGSTKSYTLTNSIQTVTGLYNYTNGNQTVLPGKNEGKTYIANVTGKPDLVQVAPVREGKQCETTSSSSDIIDCEFLN